MGIFAKQNNNNNYDDDDMTKSVFGFDSFDREESGGMTVRWTARRHRLSSNSDHAPFASVVVGVYGGGMDDDDDDDITNICPCRCLFFTLKEAIFLVISALGCGVFLAGIIALCLYLSGEYFVD